MKHLRTFILLTLITCIVASCADGERMRQRLAYMQACNQADTVFSANWLPTVDSLVNYFDSHGSSNEQMQAHYLLARTYADMGEAPQALDEFHRAAECADTTAQDCNFTTLMAIYGQISVLFHSQFLPDDEISAIRLLMQMARKKNDKLMEALAMSRLAGPYFLKSDTDSVLFVERQARELFLQHGYKEYAGQIVLGL